MDLKCGYYEMYRTLTKLSLVSKLQYFPYVYLYVVDFMRTEDYRILYVVYGMWYLYTPPSMYPSKTH